MDAPWLDRTELAAWVRVAAVLELAAERARTRGGFTASAAFLERSSMLTVDPRHRGRRALAAARDRQRSGAFDEALGLLARAQAGPLDAMEDAEADVLVSYLPVGSEEADKFYAQCCIDAGVAFVNALPVFIASDPVWAKKFEDAGVPIVGDDIKSQVGATITHRVMAKLFEDRGVALDRTYQLNVGGNMDFKNMLERDRLESKKISKTQAVTSNLSHDLGARNVHIGPSDYVQWLDDRKWAYVRLEGRAFGDVPLNLEYKLEVWDSPNSAGIIIDAIRAAKIAKDRGIGGPILPASAYLMKSPPVQMADEKARAALEAFIIGADA